MIVTNIESIAKNKYRIYVDEEFAFVLYKGELSHYSIILNEKIEEKTIQQIKEEVLLKRAKLRAMHLLNKMGRTEEQLRQKLRQNEYPEDVIAGAMQYVKKFGYINDKEYVRSFVLARSDRKSKRELTMLLGQKGISKDLIEEVTEELYEQDSEVETICRLLEKKHWDPACEDRKIKEKMMAYLMRKGFLYEDIYKAMQLSNTNA